MSDEGLAIAIFNTVRYFDLFDQPITATQIWRTLLVTPAETNVRWAGHPVYRLHDITNALHSSSFLQQKLGARWGYYFLRGRESLVKERLKRHALAQSKWKLTIKVVRWLALMPFVRTIAMSGSLAQGNTRKSSDLDLFVIARGGRIWLARLGLLLATQLTGRRRKYWDREAPDKVCLNHYVADNALPVPSVDRNLYTAVINHHHVPLVGLEEYAEFQHVNNSWIKRWIMYPEMPLLPMMHRIKVSRIGRSIKKGIENILAEPLFDWVEKIAEHWQRLSIIKHSQPGRPGRIFMSNAELAFHPDSKVPGILERFFQDADQKALW